MLFRFDMRHKIVKKKISAFAVCDCLRCHCAFHPSGGHEGDATIARKNSVNHLIHCHGNAIKKGKENPLSLTCVSKNNYFTVLKRLVKMSPTSACNRCRKASLWHRKSDILT